MVCDGSGLIRRVTSLEGGNLVVFYYLSASKTSSGITFNRYARNQKIANPNNLKVFGNKKTEGPNYYYFDIF